MIAREDHHIFRFIAIDDVEVLGYRIGGTAIPVFAVYALLRRQKIDKLVHLFAKERPAALNMLHQRVGLVLSDHANTADPGVNTVG